MTKEEIIAILERDIHLLKWSYPHGIKSETEAEICPMNGKLDEWLLISFEFWPWHPYAPRKLNDIVINLYWGDGFEEYVYADDLENHQLWNILSMLGIEDYAKDLDLMI